MKQTLSVLTAFALSSSLITQINAGEKATEKQQEEDHKTQKPNIVLIYVDDVGYGDISCYGAKGVETPHIDSLADTGLQFTDAHCTAATSTPSRFSMLTGSYAFRDDAHILPGDAPMLIDTNQLTLPSMLRNAGYTTGIIGKWHLGLGEGKVDWNKKIAPGPLEVGFDYSFLLPATNDRVPCVWIENHHVVDLDEEDPIRISYGNKVGNEPTGMSHPNLLKMGADEQHSGTIINGVSRIGYMAGGHTARWKDERFPYTMLRKARNFIDERSEEEPFFLYYSMVEPHVPRVPNQKFVGESGMGPRGDVLVQMDWTVGKIMEKLEQIGEKDNTIVIFTSDNGPVLDDGYDDQAEELLGKHQPAGPFSGGKYSALEGGTRVPMIISWPGVIEPGKTDALVNQIDFLHSFAGMTGQTLRDGEAPDSYDMLPALLGESDEGRQTMVEESWTLSLRQGKWKYIQPGNAPQWIKDKGIDPGESSNPQLYNLEKDIGETTNVAPEYPDKIKEMKEMLETIQEQGHSRPGID